MGDRRQIAPVIARVGGNVRGSDRHQQRAVGRELPDRVIAVVGAVDHVIRTDGDPMRARREDVLAP